MAGASVAAVVVVFAETVSEMTPGDVIDCETPLWSGYCVGLHHHHCPGLFVLSIFESI